MLLTGCGTYKDPREDKPMVRPRDREGDQSGKLFGDIFVFGGEKKESSHKGIGVNVFLWRGSLDTLSFMPLASADPFGGVIITDWYSATQAPDERFKVNVLILGQQLRSDGLCVSLFKQIKKNGEWVDTPVSPEMITKLEDAILKRARQIKVKGISR